MVLLVAAVSGQAEKFVSLSWPACYNSNCCRSDLEFQASIPSCIMHIGIEEVIPDNFSGIVPLFPLPNLVMFPGVVQPLQIFEPRYRAMMNWTMKHEQLIAMTVLKRSLDPGQESQFPEIHPVVCVGKVIAHTLLDDGRYKILLMGGRRANITRELSAPQPFRSASVQLLKDEFRSADAANREANFKTLAKAFLRHLAGSQNDCREFEELVRAKLSPGLLTDLIASTLDIDLDIKYELLSITNVDRRAEILTRELFQIQQRYNCPAGAFPPKFSNN
jgi:Lon protease-like protein